MLRRLATRLLPTYGAVAVLALGWFLLAGGGPTLDVTDTAWLMRGDWNMALFGWLFARSADLGFPLGLAPGLLHPYGSSLGFTDAIPWVGVTARFLSPVLPDPFQYVGPWLLSCFVLTAWCGVWLAEQVTGDRVAQALTGALCLVMPITLGRLSHPSLCAQWLVLGQVALFFARPASVRLVRRVLLASLAGVVLAAGVHVYLAAMALPLAWALVVAQRRGPGAPRPLELLAWAVGLPVALAVSLAALGFFSGPPAQLGAEGFGQFSADALTLINPMGGSRLLGRLPTGPRQFEGYAWLGLGVVALLPLSLWSRFFVSRQRALERAVAWPLFVACALMAVYALSSQVTAAGKPVVNLHALYAPLASVTGMLRSSGRFAWPLMWLVATLVVVEVLRLGAHRRLPARLALAVAVLAQAGDLQVSRSALNRPEPQIPLSVLSAPEWTLLAPEYKHLALHPVHLQWVCRYDPPLVARFGALAARQHLTFNSGHVARVPAAFPQACEQRLPPGPLEGGTVFIVTARELADDFAGPRATCGVVEGALMCVSSARDTALRRALSAQVDPFGRPRP